MLRRRALLRAGVGATAAALAGCGFELQRSPPLPFTRIALSGFAPRSPLERDLRAALAPQVQIVPLAPQADVVLRSLADVEQKTVVASTSASLVREVQLRVRLRFVISSGAGRELAPAAELMVVRDLSYNEAQALAKAHEETQILRDMRADIVLQVLRRLSALRL